jgi:hypothetical protein
MFNASISEIEINDHKVSGLIEWQDEEEKQAFSWLTDLDDVALDKAKRICDYLTVNGLLNGDKILLSEGELKHRLTELGWSLSEAGDNIDCLCSVEVKMVDDGEETDSFFVHF